MINWEEIFGTEKNPDKLFDSFYDKISEIVDLHVPVIQLSKKEMKIKSKPWMTPAIQISISKKNKLYKNYLKTKFVHYYTRFKNVGVSVGGSVGLTSGVVDGVASSSDSSDSSRAAKFLFALRPMGAGAVVVQQVLVRRVFIPLTVGLDLNSVNARQNVSRLFAAYCCGR